MRSTVIMNIQFSLLFFGLLVSVTTLRPSPAMGHAGEQDVVASLSADIESHGETAELLMRRARSYRILGQEQEERADLQRVIYVYPDFRPARIELARFHLLRQDAKAALEMATALLEDSPDDRDAGNLYAICGGAHMSTGRSEAAAESYGRALDRCPDEVDWHLKRSEALARRGRHRERAVILKTARARIPSIVLEMEWIDALIDCGDERSAEKAIVAIEPKLERARLRSSWLLRRARANIVLNQPQAAKSDLAAALRELDDRIEVRNPDASLLVDRAYVQVLLGEDVQARRDLTAAIRHRASGWRVDRVQRVFADLATNE